MTKKILFFVVLFNLSGVANIASSEIIPLKKPIQTEEETQKKLDTAQSVSNEILEEAKKDSDKLVIELNDKFHKTSEIKKNLAETKISQMLSLIHI